MKVAEVKLARFCDFCGEGKTKGDRACSICSSDVCALPLCTVILPPSEGKRAYDGKEEVSRMLQGILDGARRISNADPVQVERRDIAICPDCARLSLIEICKRAYKNPEYIDVEDLFS